MAKLREVVRGALVKSIAVLMTGTLIAQVISLAATPVLSRLFTPEDFGVLGLVNAFAMLFVGVAALRYDMAIVLPESDEEAASALALSALCVVGVTATVALIVAIARQWVAGLLGNEALADWLWLCPLIVAASGFYNVLNYWCVRRKRFRRLSVVAVVAALSSLGAKVGGGVARLGATGLVGGQVLGQVLATLALGAAVALEDLRTIREAARWSVVKKLAREHVDFPRYQAPTTVLNGLAQNLPIYMLGAFYTEAEVGQWSLALLLLTVPVFLVSNAVRQVLFQRASEMYNRGDDVSALYLKSTLGLFAVGALPALVGSLTAPWLFPLLLGEQWGLAGQLAQAMAVWQLTVLINAPTAAIFPVLRLQRLVFIWQVVGIGVAAGVLYAVGRGGDARMTVAAYSVVMAGLNLLLAALVYARCRAARRGAAPD